VIPKDFGISKRYWHSKKRWQFKRISVAQKEFVMRIALLFLFVSLLAWPAVVCAESVSLDGSGFGEGETPRRNYNYGQRNDSVNVHHDLLPIVTPPVLAKSYTYYPPEPDEGEADEGGAGLTDYHNACTFSISGGAFAGSDPDNNAFYPTEYRHNGMIKFEYYLSAGSKIMCVTYN
jgi:hypothetical protein